jgi:endoglucanase Acf2
MIVVQGDMFRLVRLLGVLPVVAGVSWICGASRLAAAGGIVEVGAGSYASDRPAGCKPLPDRVFRSGSGVGAMPTNQWWSSLAFQPFSQNMFAHPLAMVCVPGGLAVSYPGASLTSSPAAIMGSGVTKQGDLILGHSAIPDFPEALCDGYSDWFVSARFGTEAAGMRASFGHGSPFVFCTYAGGDPVVRFAAKPVVWSGTASSAVLGVTVNGHHYALFGPAGSTWTGLDTATFTNHPGAKRYFAVALLPDNSAATLALFQQFGYNHVTGTRVDWHLAGGTLIADYRFEVTPMEGSATGTLFTLYPHQWKYTTAPLTPMTYGSVRGTLKVGTGGGFQTRVPIQGVLPLLPKQGIADRPRILAELKLEADKPREEFKDTYWEGKLLGRLATLSGVAEAAAAPDLQQLFIAEIKRRLENWLTASPNEEAPLFYYNPAWGTLVGSKPAYGSDSSLNDHHFHYGYFIRAAGEVARLDPAWAKKWQPMVNLLIRDIASPDRADPMFPHLRCFDKFAGHSWASGDANFADGNNQESSSESLNAWYGMILWGAASGDTVVRDTGIALFNTERTAVEEYWFDVSNTNFPTDFPREALGMVWGGKGAFATWFSADIDCIHGINWLPFTPASLALGRSPAYVERNVARILAERKEGKNLNNGWGDLVAMFAALADPASSAAYLTANPACKIEPGNTRAFMDHWIHTLDRLGRNDSLLTAEHPFHAVFQKSGRKTYVAYNYGAEPLTVTFSDGTKLVAKPRGLSVAP